MHIYTYIYIYYVIVPFFAEAPRWTQSHQAHEYMHAQPTHEVRGPNTCGVMLASFTSAFSIGGINHDSVAPRSHLEREDRREHAHEIRAGDQPDELRPLVDLELADRSRGCGKRR